MQSSCSRYETRLQWVRRRITPVAPTGVLFALLLLVAIMLLLTLPASATSPAEAQLSSDVASAGASALFAETDLLDGATLTVGSGNVAPGNSIVVPLDTSLDGEMLGAVTIEIQYDPAVLTVSACTSDPGGLFDTALCNISLGADKIGFTAISASGVSGDPRLAEITFQAVGAAGESSALTLTADPFSDPGGGDIAVTLQNGQVNVVSAAQLPHTLSLAVDPEAITADGVSTSTLTAEVTDKQSDPVDDGTVVVYSTDLGTFPGGSSFTPIPIGMTEVEAESTDMVKVGSWVEYPDTQASGGKGIYSNATGDMVSYEFTGTQVSVIFQKQFNAGLAEVYVDGVSYGKIDTYWDDGTGTGKLYQQEEQIATDLPYTSHVIEVAVTGEKNPASDDSYVVLDAIHVFGTDRNGAYLTNGGVSTITLTSGTTPGTAQVTACAGEACDTEPVYFRHPKGYVYLPIIFKEYVEPLPPECEELIRNGSFEDNTAWIRGVTPRTARYTTEEAHDGARSMLLGLKAGETDVRSYSSVRQTITLPDDIDTATLTFWYYPISELDDGDRQDVLLLNEHDQLVAILMRDNVNGSDWTKMSYDLSGYAGQTLQVYFNAYNDEDGTGVTAYYLDDVSVEVCEGEPKPPEPTPPPPPLDCYQKFVEDVNVGDAPHGVAIDSDGKRLYVANHGDDTLSVIHSETYASLSTVPVGAGPNGVAYNAANDRIYVANRNANSVTVLEASDLGSSWTVGVGQQPNGLAANATTNKVYVANYGSGTVSVIDGTSNSVSKTISVGAGPSMVAINPLTNKTYVSLHGEGKVAVIDGAGGVTKVDLYSSGPYGIAVDTVRNLVYVVTIDTYRIVAIDGNKDEFLGWAEIRRMPGAEPVPLRMIAVNPLIGTSGHIFVTTTAGDGGWNKVLMLPKGWPEYFARAYGLVLAEPREGIAFEPTSLRVFVTSRSDDLVAAYLDGEPACPTNFLTGALGRGLQPELGEDYQADEYQIRVCVAGPDGSCTKTIIY